MLVLNHDAVVAVLPMADCIEAVREALKDFARGSSEQFQRFQLKPSVGTPLMGLMPVFGGGSAPVWCLKDVLVAPANPARGLDSHQGAILVHDGETGELLALVDATAVTAIRTAAASAVATLALAAPDIRKVAILGAGTQARAHVEAMRLILPEATISIWARSRERARQLAQELRLEAADSVEAAVTDADVVCTLTASREPLLERGWLKPGCHINAVGASAPTARELGDDIIAAAELFVDSKAQAMTECGEILIPLAEGQIGPEHVRAELGEVLIGARTGRSGPGALTVFKSLGLAVEDMGAALRAIRNARATGLGQEVSWQQPA